MSFINKSVNFSQTDMLKRDYLAPLLEKYNIHMLIYGMYDKGIVMSLESQMSDMLIPNNNKKMYLYINNKNILDGGKDMYNILYFFPDEFTEMWYKKNGYCLDNSISDFYLETDCILKNSYLFEGYLYKREDKKVEFLISDILIQNDNIVTCDYALRYAMINEILYYDIKKPLKDLNNFITINIHPIVSKSNEMLLRVMKSNFIYKDQLCCVEHVVNFKKRRYVEDVMKGKMELKKIERGKYADVYNVYHESTNDKQGILYIKGIKESKNMNNLFMNNKEERVVLKCIYNVKFSKWEPIF